MKRFIVGIADDMEPIHNLIEDFIKNHLDVIELEHFYFATDVEDFLFDTPDEIDMLLLDVDFGIGNVRGTEILPNIREYAPDLPIFLLTGSDISLEETMALHEKFKIEYIEKPVAKAELLTKILMVKKNFDILNQMQINLDEYAQYIDLIEEEREKLNLENAIEKENFASYINQINLRLEESKRIPKDVKILVQEVFPNLEFSPYVLAEILGKNFDKGIYKILKPINDGTILPAGAKKKHFVEWGVKNLYEYRLSQKSRVFIQERAGQKPLVYAVDYNHDKH